MDAQLGKIPENFDYNGKKAVSIPEKALQLLKNTQEN